MIPLVLPALAIAWLVTLLAAPVLPAAASALTYVAASLVCHQRPERSFHLATSQLPVCARCLGIYAGAAAGCVMGVMAGRAAWRSPGRGSVRGWSGRGRTLTVLALLPTAVTVALEWIGVWYPSNATRALAGAPAGYVIALMVTRALATVHYGEWAPRRPTAPSPPPSSI